MHNKNKYYLSYSSISHNKYSILDVKHITKEFANRFVDLSLKLLQRQYIETHGIFGCAITYFLKKRQSLYLT